MNNGVIKMTIGEKLREVIKNSGLSYYRLEKITGISQEYIKAITDNKIKNPRLETLDRLAKVLNTDVPTLISKSELPNQEAFNSNQILSEIKALLDKFPTNPITFVEKSESVRIPIIGKVPGAACEKKTIGVCFVLKIDIPNLVETEKLFIVIVEGDEFTQYGIMDKDRLMCAPANAVSSTDSLYIVSIGESCTIRPANNCEGLIQGKILKRLPVPQDIKFRG